MFYFKKLAEHPSDPPILPLLAEAALHGPRGRKPFLATSFRPPFDALCVGARLGELGLGELGASHGARLCAH